MALLLAVAFVVVPLVGDATTVLTAILIPFLSWRWRRWG